ncbi:biliverdin-producing heme oxygenase [Corallococcus praedator]|uniref:Biliverdin-producing heme oxygenase n=1 Tax=Corallococcus praedator TaxID=2316724 RepID=A0ABX9QQI5_9BACT|nr:MULTISPECIES: biliverdin-producing heme oxygenase [Corallococcus]RKH34427.1 biliverdin-producing heme oxygenase [Corallococcus sp. CA031C]RKI15520.1 biliverdin-producing heme oxygenase [Corallococcus praedator]
MSPQGTLRWGGIRSARDRRLGTAAAAPAETSSQPLSVRLEEGTGSARRQVEQSTFLEALFHGSWNGGVYGQFVRARHYVNHLRQLHVLYEAFESALPAVKDVALARVLRLPELRRASALAADLDWFCGDTRTQPFACAETRLHAQRIHEVATEAPHLLLAHAYARCVQDLFTAPQRAEQVAQAFELEGGRGTAFYNAVSEGEMQAFQRRLVARLDEVALGELESQEVVQEARLAFRIQGLICDELARDAPGIENPRGPFNP